MSLTNSQKERAKWKDKIVQQQNSNKNISQWCKENQILPRSFYYWRSKIYPKPIDRSSFTELTDSAKPGITIEYRGIRISIDKNFDLTVLKQCLNAIREIKC